MKKVFLSFSLLAATTIWAQKKDYPIQSVNFTQVKLTDHFWLPRIKTNHMVTIPASFECCESNGGIKNFEMAAAHTGKFCTIFPFDNTDIYKTIEGASYSLSIFPDKSLNHDFKRLNGLTGNRIVIIKDFSFAERVVLSS